jgi:N-acetylglutamate synthase-like GNAT family acetyltransferase
MIVRNVNGITPAPCRCGDWFSHWLNFSGQPPPPICPIMECQNPPEVGVLVQVKTPSGPIWHVLPVCRAHLEERGGLVISDVVVLVPICACEACADDTPYPVAAKAEAAMLDEFFWHILWQPLGLPRDIREQFRDKGEIKEFAVRRKGRLIAGLSANWTSTNEIELRHFAVHPEAQRQGVGSRLVAALREHAAGLGGRRIHTIARNTSAEFFRRSGFQDAPGSPPKHPAFTKHGISFVRLEMPL